MSSLIQAERPAGGDSEGLLVLHHGRGTNERDLLGLADALDPERRLHVLAPRAPLALPGSPGYHWYRVPRVGYPDHDTFHAARGALAELHDGLWRETGIEPSRTVLGVDDRRGTRVFISHGRADPVMEVGFARRARELLETGGLGVEYREFDGGHQIDPSHLPAAVEWLGHVLPPAAGDAGHRPSGDADL